MLPGPNIIYKCPHCGNFLKNGSLQSGNTFGAKVYSDGKRIAPMLPEFPNLTQCKKCMHFLWLNKLEEIGTSEWGDNENTDWANADYAQFLRLDDYFQALDAGIIQDKDDEVYIRVKIWQSYNDRIRIRKKKSLFVDENDEIRWADNCRKLIPLLNLSDLNDGIMAAELYRNLGDFERCCAIIHAIDNDELNWLKEKFIHECEMKNKEVVVLD